MPCNSPAANLICVGSSDNHDLRSDFSNYSATAVDLFAPGTYIVSPPRQRLHVRHGTSMASPHVAGAAALLASARPNATVAQLRAALLGGVDAKGAFSGFAATGGRLNAATALTVIAGVARPPRPRRRRRARRPRRRAGPDAHRRPPEADPGAAGPAGRRPAPRRP